MAKIFFVGLDGTEKSYRLQTHRPFTVGRDPGNDIILRDPKVSRHHAEIVFERGFFVLHDLASANGTYVNGKRVRVAPLTHGAKLRMGNSYGRFSEELPTETDTPGSEQQFDPSAPVQQPIENLPTTAHERASVQTLPHEKVVEGDVKKKSGVDPLDRPTEPLDAPLERRITSPDDKPAHDSIFAGNRYRFQGGVRWGETVNIRNRDGQVVLTYRSFASVVSIVAVLVAGIVIVAGVAAALFLIAEKRPGAAAASIILSFGFSAIIAALVPRTRVTLYDGSKPALLIAQVSKAALPRTVFAVSTPEGETIALLKRSALARLGRNTWSIDSPADQRASAYATEESFQRAIVRKVAGKFDRAREANVNIVHQGVASGVIVRRPDPNGDHDYLDLMPNGTLDRRVAVALATLVFGAEP